jgi:hypothetical protein
MRPAFLSILALLCLPGVALAQATTEAPAAVAAQPAGEGPRITIELNKLEKTEDACRGYFVIDNGMPDTLKELQIEVFLFDKQGVILRRVALPFPDVRSGRIKVVLFDLSGVACGDIGRLLVNGVLTCTAASGAPIEGCADRLAVTSRAEAEFAY